MATSMRVFEESYLAGADLSAHQYKGVSLSAANTVVLQGATGICIGVLQNKPRAGEAARIMHIGRSPALVDGTVAIAVGDKLAPDASGVFVKAPLGTEPNIIGVALEAAVSANVVIAMLLDFY